MRNIMQSSVLPTLLAVFLFVGYFFSHEQSTAAQTDNPAVGTGVALTLTAFVQSLSTPTLNVEEQIQATVAATLHRTVWIEDSDGEIYRFMESLPFEIRAENKASASLLVVISETQIEKTPLTITGCGSVDRFAVDLTITLFNQKENNQIIATENLEGHTPNPFIVTNCNTLYGRPTFELFFNWLAPHAYLFATPTPTPSNTSVPTYTPTPSVTPTQSK